MSNKKITEEMLNANEISKDTKIIVSNFNQIQKGIKNNTDALQELRNALTAYQTALKDTGNAEESGLDKIKKIMDKIDTVKDVVERFKNVGRGKTFPLSHCYCFENTDHNMCSLGY